MRQSPPPRPAATVLVLRDATDGFEVLMLRRNLNSDFVGGAYVFPGGAVDPADASEERVVGLTDDEASRVLDLGAGGRAYFVAALRELFEEAGLLVACDEAGVAPRHEPAMATRLADARVALNEGREILSQLLARERLWLDLRGVAYLAHWVTPVGPPRRFDTRFFVVTAPEGQGASHDDAETVASAWVSPREALEAQARGEYEMIFPTIRTLQSVAGFASAAEVIGFARGQATVATVEPRLVERGGVLTVLIQGDEGYDD
ncbi:MAG: NUDIX domain-containing protein [Acidimicrobiales bacterium]